MNDKVVTAYLFACRHNDKALIGILRIALRDTLARAMKAGFFSKHTEVMELIGCAECLLDKSRGIDDGWNPRHTWQWEQWQAAADAELRGGKR